MFTVPITSKDVTGFFLNFPNAISCSGSDLEKIDRNLKRGINKQVQLAEKSEQKFVKLKTKNRLI